MLRDMEITDKDPYTPEERAGIITKTLEDEGYKHNRDFVIMTVPNITHITYGRDVGYTIEQEHLGEDIESISATKIRNS